MNADSQITTWERRSKRTRTVTEAVWSASTDTTNTTTTVTAQVVYAVRNGPAVPMYPNNHSASGTRLYVPTRVIVDRIYGSKGEPTATVVGHLLRKDGSLGEATHTLHGFGYRSSARAPWPAWLVAIVQDSAK